MGLLTGDYGHEDRYVGGAAAQNGKYDPDKHVAAQIKDSDNKNKSKGSGKAASAAKGVNGILNWLSR
jgi:hypothetical protein